MRILDLAKNISASAAALACCISIAQAQTAPTLQGAIEGLGQRPCQEIIQAKQNNPEQYKNFALWLSGFMSAANGYQANTYDLTPWQPLEMSIAQIHQYCGANPDQPFAQAAVSYLTFLRAKRIRTPEKLVSIRNGETGLFIYPSVLEQVRLRLQQDGMLTLDHPGGFDDQVVQALGIFQQINGLNKTGLPDTQTLIKLLR